MTGSARPPAEGHRPSLTAFRQQRIVALSKQAGVVSLGITTAALAKAFLQKQWQDMRVLCLYYVGLYLPTASVLLGARGPPVVVSVVLGHLIVTLCDILIAWGWLPLIEAIRAVYVNRQETICEGMCSISGQLDLVTMGALQALRQVARALIYIRCMGGDPWYSAQRWTLNWVVLMALQCAYELRTRYLYRKTQQADGQTSLAVADKGAAGQKVHEVSASSSRTAEQGDAAPDARSVSKEWSTLHTNRSPGLHDSSSSTLNESCSPDSAKRSLENSAERLPHPAAAPAGAPAAAAAPSTAPAAPASGVDNDRLARLLAAAQMAGVRLPVLAASRAVATRVPYKRIPRYGDTMVHMKLKDLEPEQLPADFSTAVQSQLKPCMPGSNLTGVSIRYGCVMIALGLTTNGQRGSAPTLSTVVRALSKALVACKADRHLRDKAPLTAQATAQAASELASFAWDCNTHEYVKSDSIDTKLTTLLQLAALCRLADVAPVVQCLPAAAAATPAAAALSSQRVQLALQLAVPIRARLLGWQPRGSPVSAEAQALTLTAGAPLLDVAVLVRWHGGPYLPVTIKLGQDAQAASAGDGTLTVNVKAEADVPCQKTSGLTVELWAKAPRATGPTGEPAAGGSPELLVAHCPVLLLTPQQQTAASQLAQLVQSLGGVTASCDLPLPSPAAAATPAATATITTTAAAAAAAAATPEPDATAFVGDFAAWLAYMAGASDGKTSEPEIARKMALVGTSLLIHAVRNGAADVAQLIVTVMTECDSNTAQDEISAEGVSAGWFVAAARPEAGRGEGDGDLPPLLNAAMACGNTDMLEKVLRWGHVCGGRQWRWPWSLTDDTGFTPLHYAASEPTLASCTAPIDIFKRMLRSSDVDAARNAWLNEQGALGVTPAELFAAVHPDHEAAGESLWATPSGSSSNAKGSSQTAAATAADAAGSSSRGSDAVGPSKAGGEGARGRGVVDDLVGTGDDLGELLEPTPGFWALMKEAWQWKPSAEYESWGLKQFSGFIQLWALILTMIHTVCIVRGAKSAHFVEEATHVSMHGVPYLPMLAEAVGYKKLGSWRTWMYIMPFTQCIAYMLIYVSDPAHLPGFNASAWAGGDYVYMLLMSAGEQNPLPYMLLTRLLLCYCHGQAYVTTGFKHPMLQAIALHVITVLMCTVIRYYQVKSYNAWLAQERRRRAVVKPREDVSVGEDTAAGSSAAAVTAGPSGAGKRKQE